MDNSASNNQQLLTIHHSAEHVLMQAMEELGYNFQMAMGPATDEGFYFDFELLDDEKISEDDFPKIEEKMREIINRNLPFVREEVSANDARELFENNPYKQEWIDEFEQEGEEISIYWTGEPHLDNAFVDLCRGPHVNSTAEIGAFKLLSIAGAYWRGSEENQMLTRIYGTAFPSPKELDEYLAMRAEAEKRDHKKLGKKLGIYVTSDLVGPGLPMYGPNGAVIIENIENFMRQLQHETGYDHVYTPHIAKEDLFQKSGHLQWFAESMYPPMEFEGEGKYYTKPMNCPFHIQIYQDEIRSYRDLPIRYAEFGTVYRYEKSGEISGLLRTRGFTQDDAHIFCTEDQVVDEFVKVFKFTNKLLLGLGLENHHHRLSLPGTEKDRYAGNKKQWDKAIQLIREALDSAGIDYSEADGEAAFYGPKLDIIFEDALGRDWQISTIQVDFLLPGRFDLKYVDSDGQKKQPYMIHRAPLGSRERVLAILIEHHAGAFPVWLSPIQARIIPISNDQADYARKIQENLKSQFSTLRVESDNSNETLSNKIRKAQEQKIPYMLIVGGREEENKTVSLRLRNEKEIGEISVEEFANTASSIITNKSLGLW